MTDEMQKAPKPAGTFFLFYLFVFICLYFFLLIGLAASKEDANKVEV